MSEDRKHTECARCGEEAFQWYHRICDACGWDANEDGDHSLQTAAGASYIKHFGARATAAAEADVLDTLLRIAGKHLVVLERELFCAYKDGHPGYETVLDAELYECRRALAWKEKS